MPVSGRVLPRLSPVILARIEPVWVMVQRAD